jgi:hypothetical protein
MIRARVGRDQFRLHFTKHGTRSNCKIKPKAIIAASRKKLRRTSLH